MAASGVAGAGLALAILAWPGPAYAGHEAARGPELEIAGGAGCPWIEARADARDLCGCGDVLVTVIEGPAPAGEWDDGAWDEGDDPGNDGHDGTSSGGGPGSSGGGPGSSGGDPGSSGGGPGASGGGPGSNGGGSSTSGSTGGSAGGGGRNWLSWVLPWLLIGLGVLVLAGLFVALLRGRRGAVAKPGPEA